MQLICPHCKTSYVVADTAIGATGRSVRCVRCRNVWRTEPASATTGASEEVAFRTELGAPELEPSPPTAPEAEPSPQPEGDQAAAPPADDVVDLNASAGPGSDPAPDPSPAALSDIPIPLDNAPPLVPAQGDGMAPAPAIENDAGDVESVAARRIRAAKRRRGRLRIPLPLAIAAMLVLCAGLIGMRKDVVRHAPQLASLYASVGLPVNLRGLDFSSVKLGSEIHDGVPVLVVEGAIISKANMPVDVPRLRFSLRNASGAELYAWTAQPAQAVLKPGESMPFRSRLASPPAEGHDVQVRFFNHRDAVAGLR